ncbi:MEST protein, partial [Podargus strigoides]|nr:MEST protein [Podargus strigoides]
DSAGIVGSSDIIILLHGFPTSSYDGCEFVGLWWVRLSLQLLSHFALQRPHRYTIFEQANIIEGLVRHLGLRHQRINLLSHNYGDTVAQELLHIADMGEIWSQGHNHICIFICCLNKKHPLGSLLSSGMVSRPKEAVQGRCRSHLGLIALRGISRLCSTSRHRPLPNNRFLFSILQYINQRKKQRPLMSTSVPLHLIYGPLDPVNPHPEFLQLYKTMPDTEKVLPMSTVSVLDDHISHYPQLEDPTGFLNTYLNFINSF